MYTDVKLSDLFNLINLSMHVKIHEVETPISLFFVLFFYISGFIFSSSCCHLLLSCQSFFVKCMKSVTPDHPV